MEIIGDFLKEPVRNLLEYYGSLLTNIGMGLLKITSIFLPTSVFAFALLLGAYWERKKEEERELPDFVKKLLEFKEAPDYFLENIEQEINLPPLTLEMIQLIFDPNKIEQIFRKLKEYDNKIKEIENKLKIIRKLEIIEKINEIVTTELLSRIVPATNIRDPMENLKIHLDIVGRDLEIPKIENLRLEFESDEKKFEEITDTIEKSKADKNPSIIIVRGVSGSGKTTFIYNLVKRIEENKNWDILMFEKIGDLEIFAAEILENEQVKELSEKMKSKKIEIDIKKYILKGDKKILYCIYKDSVSVIGSDNERRKNVGRLEESMLGNLMEIIEKGLFDSIIIECRDEWFNELSNALENKIKCKIFELETSYEKRFTVELKTLEIKRDKNDIESLFNKFKKISKRIDNDHLKEVLRLSKNIEGESKDGAYSLLAAILLLIWIHSGEDTKNFKNINEFLKKYVWKVYLNYDWEGVIITSIARRQIKKKDEKNKDKYYTYIPVELLRETVFRLVIDGVENKKDEYEYFKELIENYPEYYDGFVDNCRSIFDFEKRGTEYETLNKLGKLIEQFFKLQSDCEGSLNYPTIYTNAIKKLLEILVEMKEKIEELESEWKRDQLPKPHFPDPSEIRWENFVVDLFVRHNIEKVSVPLVAYDNVDFPDDYIDKILEELPEAYREFYKNEIIEELDEIRKSSKILYYIFNLNSSEAKRSLSEKLLDLATDNRDFDSTFHYYCLYLWKHTYGIIDSFNIREKLRKLRITKEDFRIKDFGKEVSNKEFSYVVNFPIYCDETIKRCKKLKLNLNYDILKAGFKDTPNVHLLKNLVDYSDEKYLIPQLRDEYWTEIKEYGNLWFTKEAYEAGALDLIMTLGGAWLLKDDFIYKGDHDVAFFIQHPFQEKVLAEILNLQNPRYPFEMIRHWYKWKESEDNKVLFIWIRESVQPVGNIIKVTKNIEEKLSSGEKKYCWNIIKEKLGVKEGELLLQFQVHDHFVRTRTSAVQLIAKSNSKLIDIVEKFLARQIALAEIFGYKTEKEKVLKLLKGSFPTIKESVDSINNNVRYSLEKIQTDLKITNWFVHPEKWVSYGEKEAFKVLNPSAILLREIYVANLMLKVIDCYIKQTEEKSSNKTDVTKINLLFSKYSILSFLYEHYFNEISWIKRAGNDIDIKENISDEDLEILRRELEDLEGQCKESLKTIEEDLKFVKNNKNEVSKLLGRKEEDINYWKNEVKWLIEKMETLREAGNYENK